MNRRELLRALGVAPVVSYPGGNPDQPSPGMRGGLPATRPDQRHLPPAPGVAPGSRSNVIRARLVIISGTGATSGLFVYNGTPALGNPPQVAIVPTGVTTDPYGNAITSSEILIQGNVITETGGIFRTAATAPLIQLDGPHDALLIYDSSANLIATITPASGNDGLGNTFEAGVNAYLTIASGTGAGRYAVALGDTAFPFGNFATMTLQNLTHPAHQPVAVQAQIDPTEGNTIVLSTGEALSADSPGFLQIFDSHATGSPFGYFSGALVLFTQANALGANSQGAVIGTDASGFFGTLPASGTDDTNQYPSGPAVSYLTANATQCSSTTQTSTGLSLPVGKAQYWFEAELYIDQQSTNLDYISMSGPATSAFYATIIYEQINIATAGDAEHWTVEQTTIGTNTGLEMGRTPVSGQTYIVKIKGYATFTASGNLTVSQASSADAASFTVLKGSSLKLYPQS